MSQYFIIIIIKYRNIFKKGAKYRKRLKIEENKQTKCYILMCIINSNESVENKNKTSLI